MKITLLEVLKMMNGYLRLQQKGIDDESEKKVLFFDTKDNLLLLVDEINAYNQQYYPYNFWPAYR